MRLDDHALAVGALRVNAANLALGHEVFEGNGATFVRDTRYPNVYDANHVTHVTASSRDEIDALFARVEREYAHCKHRSFHTDVTTPPPVAARLALEGYTHDNALVMLLEGDLRATPKAIDIRHLADEDGWRDLERLHALDWRESSDRGGRDASPDLAPMLFAAQRVKAPPVRYFLAYVEGVARGYFNAWEGTDGVGQVENLFVEAACRHRGIAMALIARCVDDARNHGAGPVVIVADPTDTPKRMYDAMGFRPIALKRNWLRRL